MIELSPMPDGTMSVEFIPVPIDTTPLEPGKQQPPHVASNSSLAHAGAMAEAAGAGAGAGAASGSGSGGSGMQRGGPMGDVMDFTRMASCSSTMSALHRAANAAAAAHHAGASGDAAGGGRIRSAPPVVGGASRLGGGAGRSVGFSVDAVAADPQQQQGLGVAAAGPKGPAGLAQEGLMGEPSGASDGTACGLVGGSDGDEDGAAADDDGEVQQRPAAVDPRTTTALC